MALPPIVEYLLSLGDEREAVVYHGVSQLLIPAFPPNTTIILATAPFAGEFGYISYANAIGPAVIPGAFWYASQHRGNRYSFGALSSWYTNNTVDTFLVVTANSPLLTYITNLTALNQYYEGVSFFIGIYSEASYLKILEALKHLATSAKSESLAGEAVQLLKRLLGQREMPPPQPIPGER